MPKKQTKKKRPSTLELSNHLPIEGQGRDEMLQIYSWSFEDAWKEQEEWETIYGPNIQGRGPFFRWIGAQELKKLHDIYQAGNDMAITEALFVCSLNSLAIPRWCEMAYLKAYRKVRQYEAKSWDDVFGRPHRKGIHLSAMSDKRKKMWGVYRRIRDIKSRNPEKPIDESMFEDVGKEYGLCKSLANEYYYEAKQRFKLLK